MEQILKKPYEISIWRDVFDTDLDKFVEEKIAVIGSDNMTSPDRAYEPVLNENVNGEVTFSFSMIHKYFDEETGEFYYNRWEPYLVNERKVKLKYGEKWYDFIIKNKVETSDSNVFQYELKDLFVNELSKTGYNIELSNELGGNQGKICDIAEKVVQNSGWVIDRANSDILQQRVTEPLYLATLTKDINVVNLDKEYDSKGVWYKTEVETISAGAQVYLFYSLVANKATTNYQLMLVRDKDDFEIDDENVAYGPNYFIVDNDSGAKLVPIGITKDGYEPIEFSTITYTEKYPTFVTDVDNFLEFQGHRLVYKQESMYDPIMQKNVYVTKGTNGENEEEIRYWQQSEYVTTDTLTNFITNGEDFTSISNGDITAWSKMTPANSVSTISKEAEDAIQFRPVITAKTFPEFTNDTTAEQMLNARGYLDVLFKGKGNLKDSHYLLYNSGIIDNCSLIESFVANEEYVFGFRTAYQPDSHNIVAVTDASMAGLKAVVARFTTQSAVQADGSMAYAYVIDSEDIIFDFSEPAVEGKVVSDGYFNSGDVKNQYFVTREYLIDGQLVEKEEAVTPDLNSFYVDNRYIDRADAREYRYKWDYNTNTFVPIHYTANENDNFAVDIPYFYRKAIAKKSISVEELKEGNIGIFVYMDDPLGAETTKHYLLNQVQFFKSYVLDDKQLLIGDVPEAQAIEHSYYYLAKDTEGKTSSDEVPYSAARIKDDKQYIVDGDSEEWIITPQWNELYEKVTSIEASQSNIFNILQDLCEKFQCWMRIDVAHNPDGTLNYDANPYKSIVFKEFVGKENYAGFKYGINLNSISRTVDSSEFVSKMIVAPSTNDGASGGFSTIQRAPSNPSKESTLLNFSYYVNNGLLDGPTQLNDTTKFYENTRAYNEILEAAQNELAYVNNKLTTTGALRSVYDQLLDEAKVNYEQAKQDFETVTGINYDDYLAYWQNRSDFYAYKVTDRDVEVKPNSEDSDKKDTIVTIPSIVFQIDTDEIPTGNKVLQLDNLRLSIDMGTHQTPIYDKKLMSNWSNLSEKQRKQVTFTPVLLDKKTINSPIEGDSVDVSIGKTTKEDLTKELKVATKSTAKNTLENIKVELYIRYNFPIYVSPETEEIYNNYEQIETRSYSATGLIGDSSLYNGISAITINPRGNVVDGLSVTINPEKFFVNGANQFILPDKSADGMSPGNPIEIIGMAIYSLESKTVDNCWVYQAELCGEPYINSAGKLANDIVLSTTSVLDDDNYKAPLSVELCFLSPTFYTIVADSLTVTLPLAKDVETTKDGKKIATREKIHGELLPVTSASNQGYGAYLKEIVKIEEFDTETQKQLTEIITLNNAIDQYTTVVNPVRAQYQKLVWTKDGYKNLTIDIQNVYNSNTGVNTVTVKFSEGIYGLNVKILDSYGANHLDDGSVTSTQYSFTCTQYALNQVVIENTQILIDNGYEEVTEPLIYKIEPSDSSYTRYIIKHSGAKTEQEIDEGIAEQGAQYLENNKAALGLTRYIKGYTKIKQDYINKFYEKYSRFLQEGTWNSDDYIDDELYYLDAQKVSITSAQPKVTYTIQVMDVEPLDYSELILAHDYTGYSFGVGDKTYIEDTEFFGYRYVDTADAGIIATPIQEEVVISQISHYLDSPEQDQITVQNYKTQFEDLFQRITATVQNAEYREGSYLRAAKAINPDNTLNEKLLLNSLSSTLGANIVDLASNQTVSLVDDGIVVSDSLTKANQMKLSATGLKASQNAGASWTTLIDSNSINTNMLSNGKLDVSNITIMDGDQTSFRWDAVGLNAYGYDEGTLNPDLNKNYSKSNFVRFDRFGVYGVLSNIDKEEFIPENIDDIKSVANFGLTWDGFFIKNNYTDGYVSISSDDDFQVVANDTERIKIGALTRKVDGSYRYGIRIKNDEGQSVFETSDDGNVTVTGTINATAGLFSGQVQVGSDDSYILIDGNTDIPYIASSDYLNDPMKGWKIDSTGEALFNNITVRGAIKTAVFEYAEIQAVGGVFLFRPSTTIKEDLSEVDSTNSTITFKLLLENASQFKIGEWCKISNTTVDDPESDLGDASGLVRIYQISEIEGNEVTLSSGYYEVTDGEEEDEETGEIVPITHLEPIPISVEEHEELGELVGGAFLSYGFDQEDVNYVEGVHNYGIGINSSDDSVNLPARAISLFETEISPKDTVKVGYNFTAILGTLPNLGEEAGDLYKNYLEDTQGIYTDNIYLGDANQYLSFYTDENGDKQLNIKTPNFSIDAGGNASFGGKVTAVNIVETEDNQVGTLTTSGFLYPFGYTEIIEGVPQLVHTYSVLVSDEEKGLYADSNGEFFTGTGSNYLALYERKDGSYNLDIVSQNLYLGAYDRPIEIVAEGLDNQINGKELYSIDGTVNEWQNLSVVQSEDEIIYFTIYADFDGTPVLLESEMDIVVVDSQLFANVYTTQQESGDASREDEDGKILFTYEKGANKKQVYWTNEAQTSWKVLSDGETGEYPYRVLLTNINQYTDSLGRVVYAKDDTRVDGEIPKGIYNFTIFEKNPQFFYQVTLEETLHPYYDKNTPSRRLYSIDGTTNLTRIENGERVTNYTTEVTPYPLYLDIGLAFSNLPVTYVTTIEEGGETIITEYDALYSEDCTEEIGEFLSDRLPTNASGTQKEFAQLYRDNITGLPTLDEVDSSQQPNDFYYEQGLVNQINDLNTVLQKKDVDESINEWVLSIGDSNNEAQSLISITNKKISFQKNSQDLLFIASEDAASDKQEGLSDYVNITKANVLDELKLQDYYWRQLEDGSLILTIGD